MNVNIITVVSCPFHLLLILKSFENECLMILLLFFFFQDKTVVVADFGLARIMPQNNWTAERKKFGKKHARKKRSALWCRTSITRDSYFGMIK